MVTYEQISEELGIDLEEVKRGYIVVDDPEFDVELIQKLDCLEDCGLQKFKSDTEAGEQALKDGFKLFTVKHEKLAGWYIIDKPEYRKTLFDAGYMTKEEYCA